jgi:hypothetical protein
MAAAPHQPTGSKKPWLIGIAVAAVVVVGLGAVFALRGDDAGDVADNAALPEVDAADIADDIVLPDAVVPAKAEAFSLSVAAAQAAEATTVEFDMAIEVGSSGTIEVTGGIDSEANLMTMRMDMGALLGPAGGPGGGSLDMILDGTNQVMYMDAGGFGDALPTDARWISFDYATLAEQAGQSVDDFADSFTTNPLDAARLFDQADPQDIVEVGPEDIDGVITKHFEVTVDFADVIKANPQLESQFEQGQFTSLPDEVVYDVWVTEDNQLRRMAFTLDADDQSVEMLMNMREVGGSLDVEIPDADDVFDLGAMLGG